MLVDSQVDSADSDANAYYYSPYALDLDSVLSLLLPASFPGFEKDNTTPPPFLTERSLPNEQTSKLRYRQLHMGEDQHIIFPLPVSQLKKWKLNLRNGFESFESSLFGEQWQRIEQKTLIVLGSRPHR